MEKRHLYTSRFLAPGSQSQRPSPGSSKGSGRTLRRPTAGNEAVGQVPTGTHAAGPSAQPHRKRRPNKRGSSGRKKVAAAKSKPGRIGLTQSRKPSPRTCLLTACKRRRVREQTQN